MKAPAMNKRRTPSAPANPRWVVPAACLATILALPVHAGITIPDEPLTTANRVAPNILFILDDSGSMAWHYMYNLDVLQITGPNNFVSGWTADNKGSGGDADYLSDDLDPIGIYDQNYRTNGLYYNPSLNYQPWVTAGGTDMTGGTSYTGGAFSDVDRATGNLNLSSVKRVFYVPKDLADASNAYIGNVANYWRYEINSGANGSIERGPWGVVNESVTVPAGFPRLDRDLNSDWDTDFSFNVPAGTAVLYVTSYGGTHGDNNGATNGNGRGADLYVNLGTRPQDDGSRDCSSTGSGNEEVCRIYNPTAGTWYVQLYANSRFRDVNIRVNVVANTNRCIYPGTDTNRDFIDCNEVATPTGRTPAQEKANFATWYSYHRTRSKSAKAGAGRAFRPQGNRVRVGFRTIHDNNNFDIPVSSGDGRFINDFDVTPNITNRNTWYSRLYGATSSGGTPLQESLDDAGKYFSKPDQDGPYGPEAGSNQYSCRQNFTILTTDGFWNQGEIDNGNVDGTNGTQILGTKGAEYTYTAASPYSDGKKKTLADVAMYYWRRDLRTDIDAMGHNAATREKNNVPTSAADPAFWQHMVTFGISIGLKGNSGYRSVAEVPANMSWPDPTDNEDADRIDDLLHAAVNGHGRFIAASNPTEFAAGLGEALAAIQQRTSSFSNVATNAASIRTGGKVFNASYVSGIWTGALKAWNLDAYNSPSTQAWEASIPTTGRKVFTMDGASGTTFPSATQLGVLGRTGDPVDYPVSAADNAAYITGNQTLEGPALGQLRVRNSLLGDIVGSSPQYVDDTQTIYVGANDGMLHAFDATNGQELFAYVPSIINMANLRDLSRGDYTHKFFVDGPVVVTSRKLTPGKNLLVGALGKGGRGLYGLDVSSPATFAGSSVKWELAQTPANNMGLVTGRPVLAKVKTGAVAAILGNGVNSPNDKAVLIVVNAETGAVIGEVDTGVGSSSTPNGLAAPTAVLGPDGKTVSYAYAGDRLGNVWRFDLTSASPGGWTATRLFTAKSNDGSGAAQPITGAVTVATEPSTFKRWVFLGTGSFMTTTEADDKTPLAQSLYGFIDDGSANPVAYSDLVKRTIGNTGASQDGYPVRTFEAKASLPANKKGWFVNLPGNGERIVQDAQVVANILVTASMIPEGDACEASGTGYINALDAFTGTSAGSSFFDLDGDGKTDDTMVGGVPVGSVNFGVGMPTLPIFLDGKLVVGGTGGSVSAEKPGAGGITRKSWGRVSWRELRSD
jgi:type IV pilus assembly protein PilY1